MLNRGRFPDPGPWKIPQSIEVELTDEIGIEALPKQTYERTRRRPFVFNIMIAGETGLGKTTFMNTLFNTDLTEDILAKVPQDTKTVSIEPKYYELSENGVTLNLTVIDTPGFGDQLNRESNLLPIVEYIDEQFDAYLKAERSPNFRMAIPDTRVHALLYFITPTGSRLKELDIEFLKTLSKKVNVIPIIAKADTLTPKERTSFKQSILGDISRYNIPIYPTAFTDEQENIQDIEQYIPFSVIGSDRLVEVNGKKVRGRIYRWGTVAVENDAHCDFVHLRRMLMDTCLADLIETTHTHHYANYRAGQLRANGRRESILACDDAYETRIEATKQSMVDEMFRKEEDMRSAFVQKVREKEAALREREEQLIARRTQMMTELEEQKRMLNEEERELDALLNQRNLLYG
ncbi:Septin-domain-containing protein [Syncephalis plumigaleata]|nr:Septin-domain-containing protein [Syncephalis plumigaleata]